MLELTSQTLSKSKIKKLRRMGLIEENTDLEQLFQIHKQANLGLRLTSVKPKTLNQSRVIKEYNTGKDLLIHGLPGTGKSFLALYLGLKSVLEDRTYNEVFIYRSAVPTRQIGHLPGSDKQKVEVYEAPYKKICSDLFGRGDAYDILKNKKIVNFESTSFVRGLTIDRAVVIVDEINNMSFHELDSLVTRLGDDTRIIFSGDYRQSDFKYKDEKQGLLDFISIIENMKTFAHIEMGIDDIVRSGKVRDYIIAKTSLGY